MATPEALEVAESVPQAAPLQPVPESAQLTPLFCESFCTVAVNGCVALAATEAVGGATLTEIGDGAPPVMATDADLEPSHPAVACEVPLAEIGPLPRSTSEIATSAEEECANGE